MSESSSGSQDVKTALREVLSGLCSEEDLKRWFDPVRVERAEQAGTVRLEWPHRFFGEWITPEHLAKLEQAFCAVYGEKPVLESHSGQLAYTAEAGPHTGVRLADEKTPFGDYVLDTFLVNAKNVFPFTVLQEAASGKTAYNPLTIYGDVGSGKTHMARATGNALAAVVGKQRVFCGSLDALATLAKPCTHDAQVVSMLTSLRAVIIDDVQDLHVHPFFAELLPRIVDACTEHNILFMATTSEAPARWSLPPRVAARLEQGLVLLLHEADMDIRLRFAQAENRRLHLNLGRSQLLALAQYCTGIRRLKGIMQRLEALHQVLGYDLSTQDIDRALDYTSEGRNVTPQHIIKHVATKMNVRAEDITGTKRNPKVTRARHIAMYLCRSLTGSSYPALGKLFGGRDHSTVIHSVKKIQLLWDNDKDTHKLLSELSLSCREYVR